MREPELSPLPVAARFPPPVAASDPLRRRCAPFERPARVAKNSIHHVFNRTWSARRQGIPMTRIRPGSWRRSLGPSRNFAKTFWKKSPLKKSASSFRPRKPTSKRSNEFRKTVRVPNPARRHLQANLLAEDLAKEFGVRGPVQTVSIACVSGLDRHCAGRKNNSARRGGRRVCGRRGLSVRICCGGVHRVKGD